MQKTPYVYPLVGGRKIEHLQANIDSLRISLTNEHIKYRESVLPFEPGFPYDLIVRDCHFVYTQLNVFRVDICIYRVMDRRSASCCLRLHSLTLSRGWSQSARSLLLRIKGSRREESIELLGLDLACILLV